MLYKPTNNVPPSIPPINPGDCRSIFCLTGAGVSTGAGIPDFRSPGGMYDSLRPELLTATERQRRMMQADPVHVVTKELGEW